MAKPVIIPNVFANEGTGTPNNIPLLDQNFSGLAAYANDGAFCNTRGVDTGTVNNYAVTLPAGFVPSQYAAAMRLVFNPLNTNTGPATINVNALGTQAIMTASGTPLRGGEIVAGRDCDLVYDGTNFRMMGSIPPFGATYYYDYDEFLFCPGGAAAAGSSKLFRLNANGNGTFSSGSSLLAGHPGCLSIGCGTTTSQSTGCQAVSFLFLDTFSITLRTILQTQGALDTNQTMFGLMATPNSGVTGVNPQVVFYGSSSTVNWVLYTASGSAPTSTASSVAFSASTWYDLMIVVTAASAAFYINGALQSTIGTTLPAASQALQPFIGMYAINGTNRFMVIDLFEILITGIPQLSGDPLNRFTKAPQ